MCVLFFLRLMIKYGWRIFKTIGGRLSSYKRRRHLELVIAESKQRWRTGKHFKRAKNISIECWGLPSNWASTESPSKFQYSGRRRPDCSHNGKYQTRWKNLQEFDNQRDWNYSAFWGWSHPWLRLWAKVSFGTEIPVNTNSIYFV